MSRKTWGLSSNTHSKIPIRFIEDFFKKNINIDSFGVSSDKEQATFSIDIDKDILVVLTHKLQTDLWNSNYFNISVIVQHNKLFSQVVSEKEEKIAKINQLLKIVSEVDGEINDKLSEIKELKDKYNIIDENVTTLNKKPRIIL